MAMAMVVAARSVFIVNRSCGTGYHVTSDGDDSSDYSNTFHAGYGPYAHHGTNEHVNGYNDIDGGDENFKP